MSHGEGDVQHAKRGWLDVAELGPMWGLLFFTWLCRFVGRGVARATARIPIFYYVLFNYGARRASRTYFRHLHACGIPVPHAPAGFSGQASFGMVFRHFRNFSDCAIDRLLIAARQYHLFEVTSTGRDNLEQLKAERRGALLIGAHHGSFEAMRLGAVTQSLPINMVVNSSNAQRLQYVLEKLDPELTGRVISIGGSSLDFMLRIRERVERGEMVAIMADRVTADARTLEVEFLGEKAPFAAGPFLIAATLRCPVYLVFGLYRGGNRYDLYCEKFADEIVLPRKAREQALRDTLQRYAHRLEAYVRMAPYNWFNFYDFWSRS